MRKVNKLKTSVVLIFGLLPMVLGCMDQVDHAQQAISSNQLEQVVAENGFELSYINPNSQNGMIIHDLKELENYLRFVSGQSSDQIQIQNIKDRNEVEELVVLDFSTVEFLTNGLDNSKNQSKIQCIQNWRNVTARIGVVSTRHAWIDLGFSTGTGSGLIENVNASLEGLTFSIALGKSHFRNSQRASASNGYTYEGLYTYSIRLLMFVEGIGEVATVQNKTVRIRVDGCTGQTSYSFVEE